MPTLKEQFWDPVAGFGVTFRTMFRKGRHGAVPVREAAHRPALPRPSPAQPLARRSGEVRGLRAVRLGVPGRRDLRRGGRQHRRGAVLARERYGRVYQINYLRCILCGLCRRGLPDPGADDDQRVRAGRHHPRVPHL
ncbi:MAG: hypothetical protein R2734_03190 [Nocardioides sp.]